MKAWLLLALLLVGSLPGWQWLTRVRRYNDAQALGQAAARRGRASEAAFYFEQAVALAGRTGPDPALLLDLAQAQVQASQLARARATYSRLLAVAAPAGVGSTTRQQLAGLLARQGQLAQAVRLLRQALQLNPANAAARYNYEVLSGYLATQRPPKPPASPPPPAAAQPKPPKVSPPDSAAKSGGRQPAGAAGAQGQPAPESANSQPQPGAGTGAAPAPGAAGQPSSQQPAPAPGSSAAGGLRPGAGQAQPLPSGAAPGSQRGLDRRRGADAPGAADRRGQPPGAQAATETDAQLQTQRERLKAMNLSPAQAQQLLEALRASEQQYLQQRPRPRQGPAPAPGQPTW